MYTKKYFIPAGLMHHMCMIQFQNMTSMSQVNIFKCFDYFHDDTFYPVDLELQHHESFRNYFFGNAIDRLHSILNRLVPRIYLFDNRGISLSCIFSND